MIHLTKICEFCGEELTPSEFKHHICESSLLNRINEFSTRLDTKYDSVNHPKHYTSHPSGVECIDITKHYNFQIGNAMKYLWRQGLKDEKGLDPVEKQIQDCEKAIWYINSFINDLKKEQ